MIVCFILKDKLDDIFIWTSSYSRIQIFKNYEISSVELEVEGINDDILNSTEYVATITNMPLPLDIWKPDEKFKKSTLQAMTSFIGVDISDIKIFNITSWFYSSSREKYILNMVVTNPDLVTFVRNKKISHLIED